MESLEEWGGAWKSSEGDGFVNGVLVELGGMG
jgi:hypothetical protein